MLLPIFLTCSGATAAGLEYPEPYKSPQALGMGGTGVALDDSLDALFTNPARLAAMPEGWRFDAVTLTLASSRRTESFVQGVREALHDDDTESRREALVEVLRRYRGQNVHGEAVLLPGVSWRHRELAVRLVWLAAVKLDGRSHEGFGAEGLLDVDGRTLSGPLAGLSWQRGHWRLGAAVKRLRRDRVSRTYSVRELVELTEEGRSISDDRIAGKDTGIDVGLQYAPASMRGWQPRAGLVLQNVGGLDFGPAGKIPQTMTAGVALHRPLEGFGALTLSAEYFDMLHRMPQDGSRGKRFRMGGEWLLWNRPGSALALRGGVYQQAATAGVEWHLRWLRVGLATYAEELGAHPGQDGDRRYLLTLTLGSKSR